MEQVLDWTFHKEKKLKTVKGIIYEILYKLEKRHTWQNTVRVNLVTSQMLQDPQLPGATMMQNSTVIHLF